MSALKEIVDRYDKVVGTYVQLLDDDVDLISRARAELERGVAVLAHEMAAILKHDGMDGDTAMAWLRRYEEAVKDRARAEIGE